MAGKKQEVPPLHIDTLQGIGIVAYPELVKVRQHSVVGTTAATGTCLDGKVGIFGTDALADFLEAAVEFDIHVALIILRQIVANRGSGQTYWRPI